MTFPRLSAVALTLLLARPAYADLELPAASLAAKVSQTVGLTEIEVEYSRPAARGRTIWGDLVPYDKIWRTGANRNTLIRFSGPVTIGDTELPAGEYSVHSIPGKVGWTFIINKKTTGFSSSNYDAKQDAVRIKVPAGKGPARERMLFLFTNTTNNSTYLDLEWASVKVSLPIKVGTDAAVAKAIDREVGRLWAAPAQAARYMVENGQDLDKALELAKRSLAVKSSWYGHMVHGMVEAARGNTKGAIKATEKSLTMGDESGAFRFYEGQMKSKLAEWKKK